MSGVTGQTERLKQIRERTEAATEGPWRRDDGPVGQWDLVIFDFASPGKSGLYIGFESTHDTRQAQVDADFIAHAREDIPFLLAELAVVRTERDEAQTALAVGHKFAGDIALWANSTRPPIDADWLVVGTEAEQVKRILAAALAVGEEPGQPERDMTYEEAADFTFGPAASPSVPAGEPKDGR